MNPIQQLRSLFEPIVTPLSPDKAKVADYLGAIRQAQNPEHGDYQANFAMPLAKALSKKPQEVAAQIIAQLPANDMLEMPQVAGPGFINLRLKNDWLAARVREMAADDRLGVSRAAKRKRFVIDYSSPNVAKPLHVGHIRSTIIGDALTRLLRFLGHEVITDNHLGDWGTQFGMMIHGYRTILDKDAYAADPVRELARLYRAMRMQIDKEVADLGIAKQVFPEEDLETQQSPTSTQCQLETAKLHAGDPENVALWKQFMPHCLESLQRDYRRLGILPFDYEHGESFYNPMLCEVVDDMLIKGIAFESQGAIVIPNAKGNIPKTEDERKTEDPPAIIRKSDGAFTYTTSDLATVKYRVEKFAPDVLLYVVDFRQALHFKTFFAQARRWGYTKVDMEHISFGSVLGEDKKPFGVRKGTGVELNVLINEAVNLGRIEYEASYESRKATGHEVPDLTEDAKQEIAEVVGVGAMKYADLSGNRTSDYVFSYKKMLATEGNTATYMQYAYARCRSILRKSQADEQKLRASPQAVLITHPAERALCLQLIRFEESLTAAANEFFPHYITAYLWDLAKHFSVFFENCPVLTAETAELRNSRLLLVDLCGRVIRQALDLLGIRTVERM